MQKVEYGTTTIEFDVTFKENLKNSYITVERGRKVLLKTSPETTVDEMKKLVKNRATWILKKFDELGSIPQTENIETGSRIFYLGKSYYVELIQEERETVEVTFIHSKFKIYAPLKPSQAALEMAINEFYLKKTEEKVMKLYRKFSNKMKLFAEHISFKVFERKWGSCSPRNRISFNPEMVKLSSSLMEYIVVHEIAHLAFKNHSSEFWTLVKRYMSDYARKDERLKGFEKRL